MFVKIGLRKRRNCYCWCFILFCRFSLQHNRTNERARAVEDAEARGQRTWPRVHAASYARRNVVCSPAFSHVERRVVETYETDWTATRFIRFERSRRSREKDNTRDTPYHTTAVFERWNGGVRTLKKKIMKRKSRRIDRHRRTCTCTCTRRRATVRTDFRVTRAAHVVRARVSEHDSRHRLPAAVTPRTFGHRVASFARWAHTHSHDRGCTYTTRRRWNNTWFSTSRFRRRNNVVVVMHRWRTLFPRLVHAKVCSVDPTMNSDGRIENLNPRRSSRSHDVLFNDRA